MKVGIKFCGGCMTTFNRGQVAKKIKENNPDIAFDYVNTEDIYDFIVVLQGCHVACAGLTDLQSKKGFLHVLHDDMEKIQEDLEAFKRK